MSRRDLYAVVHKGLRAFLCDTLVAVGRVDPADACAVRETLAGLAELLAFCASHVRHENAFIHPAMESRRPGSAAACLEEHAHHEAAIEALRQLASEVLDAPPDARAAPVRRLYRALAVFVADNLAHMEAEESLNNQVLWSAYTDAEIAGIEAALVGSLPPGQAMQGLRWMLPAAAPAEREAMLARMPSSPPAAREAALAVARAHLAERDYARLEGALAGRAAATLSS